ncbi:hypothetical protein D8S78_02685 [Natrialba swarupiae]|nr:hypothetical protein [Natrialba swarupiae]
MDGQARLRGFVSLLGFALGVDLVNRALGSIDLLQGMGLFGLVWLAIYLYLFVRLFAVPGLVVDGRSLPAALEESFELTAGRGWSIFGLILLFGLGAWLLAAVPHVGAAASSAIVARSTLPSSSRSSSRPVRTGERRVTSPGQAVLERPNTTITPISGLEHFGVTPTVRPVHAASAPRVLPPTRFRRAPSGRRNRR